VSTHRWREPADEPDESDLTADEIAAMLDEGEPVALAEHPGDVEPVADITVELPNSVGVFHTLFAAIEAAGVNIEDVWSHSDRAVHRLTIRVRRNDLSLAVEVLQNGAWANATVA
jgi:hypothetical protein